MLGHHGPISETPFKMPFHWRADDGLFIGIFGFSIPSSSKKKKKRYQIWTPSDKTLCIRACERLQPMSRYMSFSTVF